MQNRSGLITTSVVQSQHTRLVERDGACRADGLRVGSKSSLLASTVVRLQILGSWSVTENSRFVGRNALTGCGSGVIMLSVLSRRRPTIPTIYISLSLFLARSLSVAPFLLFLSLSRACALSHSLSLTHTLSLTGNWVWRQATYGENLPGPPSTARPVPVSSPSTDSWLAQHWLALYWFQKIAWYRFQMIAQYRF